MASWAPFASAAVRPPGPLANAAARPLGPALRSWPPGPLANAAVRPLGPALRSWQSTALAALLARLSRGLSDLTLELELELRALKTLRPFRPWR